MNIVISGSSGFLGGHLSRHLKGHINIIKTPGRHIKQNFNNDVGLKNISFFIHLSEPSLKSEYNAIKSLALIDNVKILSKKFKSRLIYFSSSSVYGDQSKESYNERSPVNESDEYTKLKLNNERIVIENGGMVVRLSNVIGSEMHKNNVFGDIKNQIIKKNSDILVFTKKSIRDYIYVKDVCNFIKIVVDSKVTKNEIYNIGSGEGKSVEEIIDLLSNHFNHNFESIIETKKTNRMSCNILDISKAYLDFNWVPLSSFRDIIKEIYK